MTSQATKSLREQRRGGIRAAAEENPCCGDVDKNDSGAGGTQGLIGSVDAYATAPMKMARGKGSGAGASARPSALSELTTCQIAHVDQVCPALIGLRAPPS